MVTRIAALACGVMLTAMPAFAQKAEVGVTFGWVFSDGVSGNTVVVPGAGTFNRIDPKDLLGWGIDVGVFVTPQAEVGFIYGNQPTKLQASGTGTIDIGDLSTNSYHGYLAYNWGESGAKIRPYV